MIFLKANQFGLLAIIHYNSPFTINTNFADKLWPLDPVEGSDRPCRTDRIPGSQRFLMPDHRWSGLNV